MLTRDVIITRTLARAARQAQIVAHRKATSAADREWCVRLIATLASLAETSEGVADQSVTAVIGPLSVWPKPESFISTVCEVSCHAVLADSSGRDCRPPRGWARVTATATGMAGHFSTKPTAKTAPDRPRCSRVFKSFEYFKNQTIKKSNNQSGAETLLDARLKALADYNRLSESLAVEQKLWSWGLRLKYGLGFTREQRADWLRTSCAIDRIILPTAASRVERYRQHVADLARRHDITLSQVIVPGADQARLIIPRRLVEHEDITSGWLYVSVLHECGHALNPCEPRHSRMPSSKVPGHTVCIECELAAWAWARQVSLVWDRDAHENQRRALATYVRYATMAQEREINRVVSWTSFQRTRIEKLRRATYMEQLERADQYSDRGRTVEGKRDLISAIGTVSLLCDACHSARATRHKTDARSITRLLCDTCRPEDCGSVAMARARLAKAMAR